MTVTSSNGSTVAADDLPLLMALAGNHQNIPSGQTVQRGFDRLCPVADFQRAGTGCQDGGADGGRIFAAGIVVGYDDDVGKAAAAWPINGRLPRSRSPPAPNTTCSRPVVCGRSAVSSRSSASGVWA